MSRSTLNLGNSTRGSNLIIKDMQTGSKILLGIGAFFVGAYYFTYRKAYSTITKCRISIDRVYLDAIDKTGFILGIRLKIVNPTKNNLNLTNGTKLYFYINNQRIAHVYVPYQQVIMADGTSEVNLAVAGEFADVGGWWNYLLDLSNTADIKVAGSLKLNGLSVPVPPITIYKYNVEDIVKNVRTYSKM